MAKEIQTIKINRITDYGKSCVSASDVVIIEKPITIIIEEVGNFTVLCTPIDIKALAIGFAFTEGIITSIDDIIDITNFNVTSSSIALRVEQAMRTNKRRNLIMTSACGMCGSRNIEKLLNDTPPCKKTLALTFSSLEKILKQLSTKQIIYEKTGGSHAAGLFNADCDIIASAEDIGRHNALDKAIGCCLLNKIPTDGCGVVLSSRISFEMVSKAAKAGTEIIIAISAPSSLAIEAAKKWNITLLGFTRNGRTNIYTCPERIKLGNQY